jgi:hypothetical protein
MKKLVYKLLGCFAGIGLILFSYFSQPSAEINKTANVETTSIPDSQFIFGAFNSGSFENPLYDTLRNLGFNTWHVYTHAIEGWPGVPNDRYDGNPGVYGPRVTGRIDANKQHNLRTFMDRPIIEYIIAGQRIDYQCESIGSSFSSNPYWFWAYNSSKNNFSDSIYDIYDYSSYGSGDTVKYCHKLVNNSGSNACWIDTGVRANRELSFVQTNYDLRDDAWDWYIMPRIRIDSAYAADLSNLSDTVCRIKIFGWRGYLVKDVGILVENFKPTSQSVYHGNYLDTFYFQYGQGNLVLSKDLITQYFLPNNSDLFPFNWPDSTCCVDIRIYWAGKCDTWFDRVRVENLPAHQYLTNKEDWIINKVNTEIGWAGTSQIPNYFYFEECQFSHFSAIAALNKQIMDVSGNTNSQIIFLNYYLFKAHMPDCWNIELSSEQLKKYLHDDFGLRTIVFGAYPFVGNASAYHGGTYDGNYSLHPRTLLDTSYDPTKGILSYTADREIYESWLQGLLDSYNGGFCFINRQMDYFMKNTDTKIIYAPQAHLWYARGHKLKEPSNEELEVETYIPLTYGAKGIMYFSFTSWGNICCLDTAYARTIMDIDIQPRHNSEYHQDKYAKFIDISKKIHKWSPYLLKFNDANRKSYSFRQDTARTALYANSYFHHFFTLRPGGSGGSQSNCEGDLTPEDVPQGWLYDCPEYTYLQVATFGSIEPNSQYFMVVNRRCSPYKNDYNDDSIGGHRKVRAYLRSNYSDFSVAGNWSIINCENDSIVATFDKSNPGYVDLGYFLPGEGKLFKMAPTVITGGTLVGDEYINSTITCNKNVYNNGHNITLGSNANISFADSAGIYMSGGNLTIGSENAESGQDKLHFTGLTGSKWQGFVLEDCGEVQIYGAYFYNILQNQPAISITNCYRYKIENNNFICAQGEKSNGVQIFYNAPSNIGNEYHYIENNTFSCYENTNSALQVISNAGTTIPVLIEGNHFTTGSGSSSSMGIFLAGISGGTIEQNDITNYTNSITLVSSSCDFFENTISSNVGSSIGIQLILGIGAGAPASNGYFVGGYNNIFTSGSNSKNIDVADSYFDINEGHNIFNIDFSNSQRHISGYFPSNSNQNYNATHNCFKNNSVEDTASIYVTQGSSGDRIAFTTDPTECDSYEFANYEIFSLGGGINDTVFIRSGGNGGGESNVQLPMDNVQLEEQIRDFNVSLLTFDFSLFKNTVNSFLRLYILQNITSYKNLKDSLNINMRKHLYSLTESQCQRMLLTYPDSSESIGAISKLYLSSLSLDSAGNHIQLVKTFYETLILNNSGNTPLIKRANYFVQKCKVALKQYTSALLGFQEIINQNPYNYEGLIASWDYAATQLLANSSGSFNNEELIMNNDESKENKESDFNNLYSMLDSLRNKKSVITSYTTENYDKKKFTKQDREVINTNVANAFNNERSKQINKLTELEKQITTLSNYTSKSKSDAQISDTRLNDAKKELKTMKTLGEIVKVKKPKTISEHIKIINADIKKVFGTDNFTGNSKTNNLLPTEYNLSQNYPNPFNPVTKINYELPKDGRVKLVIYDILGREIKTLVNELKQAGRYTVEFNGNNYASGVYFYRIQVEGGKSYTSVKKMVLVK